MNQKKPKEEILIYFNEQNLNILSKELLKRMENREFPYNLKKARLPEKEYIPSVSIMPRESRAHFLFLFHACNYMRRIDSNIAFQALTQIFKKHSEIFFPENFACSEEDEVKKKIWLKEILCEEKPLRGNINDAVKFWFYNSQKLLEFYEGHPGNIFNGKGWNDFWEIKKMIRNNEKERKQNEKHTFYGFQIKMVSMLVYFFSAGKLIEPILFPPPLDIHVIRLLLLNGVFKISNMKEAGKENGEVAVNYLTDNTKKYMARLLCTYLDEKKIDPVDFAAALWLFGRTMCSSSPINKVKKGDGSGRKTQLFFKDPSTWKPRDIIHFESTCLSCPFLQICTSRIPGAGYQIKGGFCTDPIDKVAIGKNLYMQSMFL